MTLNPSGLCQCGCGEAAPLADQTDLARGYVKGEPMRFIKNHHLRRQLKGRRLSSSGYVLIFAPNHPRAATSGSVFEHILVAEAAIGKQLPLGVVVHHVDDAKTHNAPANLCVLENNTEHVELHRRRRVLRAGGDPFVDWLCCACRQPKPMETFRRRRDGRLDSTCIPCDTQRRSARKRAARRAA